MRFVFKTIGLLVLSLMICTPVFAHPHPEHPHTEEEKLLQGDTALDMRLAQEEISYKNPFSLTPHKQNYILPFTYNSSPNNDVYESIGKQYSRTEMKFQLSFKSRIAENLFNSGGDVFFAYTHKSFWQAYDINNSAPFRETNYEPELIWRFVHDSDPADKGLKHRITSVAFNHQSNGQAGAISRSWNRLYASFLFEKPDFLDTGDLYIDIKPWVRIPEDEAQDDNPSMEKYLGYGEVLAVLHTKTLKWGLMVRNNLRAKNRGGFQVDCSFPIAWINPFTWFSSSEGKTEKCEKMRGYIQYFNGYGESLIDYDYAVSRIGVGIILIDWL